MDEVQSEKVFTPVGDIRSDPNFWLILIGAGIWFIGYYIIIFGLVMITTGFALTCYATAVSAIRRPLTNAYPGIFLGIVMHMIGTFMYELPFIKIAAPLLLVPGGVLILFFAIPLAVQKGNAPLLKAIERVKSKEKDDTTEDEKKDTE